MSVLAYAPRGVEGVLIRVETDIRRGIPGIDITGLAEKAVREARERVRAGFRNSGFNFPQDRILINLAPAGVRKEDASLDLPIAISIMAAAGTVPVPDNLMVLGELELSGRVRPVRGTLAAIAAGIDAGIQEYVVPLENSHEAAALPGIHFFAAATLAEAVHALLVRAETGLLPEHNREGASFDNSPDGELHRAAGVDAVSAVASGAGDFSEVKGQRNYKRALEIAAAGGHNLLVFGPPGSGKTMLARRFSSILPPLTPAEAVEVSRLHSLAGQIKASDLRHGGGLIREPPFRSPHHSASVEGVLGGGRSVRPGEITLAHLGTLFLDEAPEFRAPVLQSLREPLEDKVITIVRAEGAQKLPADFQLIMAANSCPCGRLGAAFPETANGGAGLYDTAFPGVANNDPCCFCTPDEIHRYWKKMGSALLDRIELRVPVRTPVILASGGEEETSGTIRRRIAAAVDIQRKRFTVLVSPPAAGLGIRRNADMTPGVIETCCPLTKRAEAAFTLAAAKLGLSGRACHGILRVARTIADLEGLDVIDVVHILEAVQHRRFGDDPYDILAR